MLGSSSDVLLQCERFPNAPGAKVVPRILLRELARNVQIPPTGEDALDLTRCIEKAVAQPDKDWYYPDDYQRLTESLRPAKVTNEHYDETVHDRWKDWHKKLANNKEQSSPDGDADSAQDPSAGLNLWPSPAAAHQLLLHLSKADDDTEDAHFLEEPTSEWLCSITVLDYPDPHAYENLVDPCSNGGFMTDEAREMEWQHKEIWQGRSLENMFAVEKKRAYDAEVDFDDFGSRKKIRMG